MIKIERTRVGFRVLRPPGAKVVQFSLGDRGGGGELGKQYQYIIKEKGLPKRTG